MDAITMLKTDHDKVKQLLTELETTTERGVKTRQELFATIKGELTIHEVIEEEIFYPALKSHPTPPWNSLVATAGNSARGSASAIAAMSTANESNSTGVDPR